MNSNNSNYGNINVVFSPLLLLDIMYYSTCFNLILFCTVLANIAVYSRSNYHNFRIFNCTILFNSIIFILLIPLVSFFSGTCYGCTYGFFTGHPHLVSSSFTYLFLLTYYIFFIFY
jgi:hypothetical protein